MRLCEVEITPTLDWTHIDSEGILDCDEGEIPSKNFWAQESARTLPFWQAGLGAGYRLVAKMLSTKSRWTRRSLESSG
jgi:hypothetical protein